MITVYIPCLVDGFQLCQPINDCDFEKINKMINGCPRRGEWRPLAVNLIDSDDGRPFLQSDSPWLGSHALIFTANALAVIGPDLEKYGELLPLISDKKRLMLFNPCCVLDALDETKSSFQRLSTGRIMRVSRYAFRQEVIGDTEIFKIQGLRVSPTFFTSRIVDAWREAGLMGLEFEKVWCS